MRDAGDSYLSALEQMPALIWRTASDGTCDYHNQTWLDFTGRTFEQERGSGWCEGVHPDDLERCIEQFERAFEARAPFEMEYRLRHHSGEYRLISDHAHPIYDTEGQFSGYLGISFDLSRHDELNAAARDGEQVFRSIFESPSVGIARTDTDGRFMLANDAFLAMLGYTMDELKDLGVQDVTHPDDWPRNKDLAERLLRNEIRSFEIQKRYVTKSGREFWVQNSVSAAFDSDGAPLYLQAIAQDINETKIGEAALREREAELAEAQAIAHVGSWAWDIGSDEVRWSDEQYRIYGREPGTPLDYPGFLQCVLPADRERVERTVRNALESGAQLDFIHGIVRPGGEVRTIHVRGRILGDESGRAIRMLGTAQDITERVQVERDLRRSGESYRMLAENVNEMIIRFSPEGRITYASPAARAILGYQPAEVIGREGSEFIYSEDLPRVVEAHTDMLHDIEPPAVLSRLVHRDGHPVWTETTTRAVRDPETGEIESIVAVSRDVTESVRTARLSRLIHVVALAANEAESARETLQVALALVCEHTGWTIGHAYVPGRNAGSEAGPLDIWHVDNPSRHALLREFMGSSVLPPGEGLLGRVLERGEAECIPDLAADPFFRRAEMARRLGVRSAFAFPIWAGDETIAVMEFFGEEPEEPDAVMIDLLSNVVTQLGEILRRKQAEQALRASEERFRALAESANDAFVTVDGRGIVVYCNQSLQRIFGYSCDEVCGKPINDLLASRHPDSRPFDLGQLLAGGDHLVGRRIELTGRRKDGGLLPLEMSLAGWQTDEGSFVTGIFRDISDRKQAEHALAEKMEELARSNAELGLFTYVASHDLREPLRTVGGNVQLLARALAGQPNDDMHRQLEFAIGGVRRMQALIEDLLAYSRVGTEGKVFAELDSADAVQEAMQALSIAIEESAGTVTVGRLPRIVGDRSQLAQLFQNLLSNAIKFHGSDPPRVNVDAEREGGAWVFSVVDRGIGIEPQYAEHVFTIFQRLHTREEYPGSGIGLAVCRKIVERHGGRIWVDSEPGQGSAFRFTIPTRGLQLA